MSNKLLSDDQAWAHFIASFDGDDQDAREAWANDQPPLIDALDPNDGDDCPHHNAYESDPNPPATFYCPDCGQNFIWPQETPA